MPPQLRSRFSSCAVATITLALVAALPAFAQTPAATIPSLPTTEAERRENDLRADIDFLASPAMQGRGAGTPYERIAAEYVASAFRRLGLEPGGTETGPDGKPGFVFRVPLPRGPEGAQTSSAAGILRGTDASAGVLFLSAHLDHLGTRERDGQTVIYPGADDDASGVATLLAVARALANGPRPKRTVYFVAFGAEERGGVASTYYAAHPPVPAKQIAADLEFEMLGRPDSAVAPGHVWLTGYERSDLGAALAAHGAPLVADPHPDQNFFQRSDNYFLARKGIVAHTISSFGLHTDYHRPTDTADKIDFGYLSSVVGGLIAPLRWLADTTAYTPTWKPGGSPAAAGNGEK